MRKHFNLSPPETPTRQKTLKMCDDLKTVNDLKNIIRDTNEDLKTMLKSVA